MKIRHEKWGEVDGVAPVTENWEATPFAWFKDGADYPRKYGWAEVKEPKFVDVTGACTITSDGGYIEINGWDVAEQPGIKFCKKHWFDLPENLLHEIHHLTAKGFLDYIQRFKKPCLIVEKEEG